jgi:tetratricopeptide (TPR) repeat protein
MRTLRWAQAVYLLAFVAAGCGSKAAGAAHIRQGDAMLSESKLQKAIGEYELALKTPARDEALSRLAGAYQSSGQFAKAQQYLKEASRARPTDPGLRLSNARILAATGRAHEAFAEAYRLAQTSAGNEAALALCAAFATTREEAKLAADKLTTWRERETHRAGAIHLPAELLVPLAWLDEKLAEPEQAKRARGEAAQAGVKDLALALELAESYASMQRWLPAEELFDLAAKRAPQRQATWLRLAAVRVELGEWSAASAALDHLDKRLRNDPDTTLIEARIRLGLDQPAAAEALLVPLIAARRGDADARRVSSRAEFWLGHARLAQHDPRGAERAFTEALHIDPGFDGAELALAELYLSEATPGRAVAQLKKLSEQKPESSAAYRLLGRALLATHDAPGASAAFQRYVELAPEDAQGPYLVATALEAQGKVDEARKRLETAIALDPNAMAPLRMLVALIVRQGQPEEAENRLQIELAHRGRSAELLTMFGDLLFDQRQAEPSRVAEAERAYREALDADPAYGPGWVALGRLYAETGRSGPALLAYQAALPQAANQVELWLRIAQLHVGHGDGVEAKAAYEQVLAREPNSVVALNDLAYVYADLLGDPAHGLELAERAHQLAPSAANVTDTYAWILWRQDGSEHALTLLQDAAKRLPDSAEAQYHLGLALVKLGQKREGRAALSRALDLSQTFAGANAARLALSAK